MTNNEFFDQIQILYENEHSLVIAKPEGLIVTPAPHHDIAKTVVGWLQLRYGESIAAAGSEFKRFGIVHRLDRETSGVMVVAKTQFGFEFLTKQFKDRTVEKHYVALVWGGVDPWQFVIDAPIRRSRRHRLRYVVGEQGREAQTRINVESVINTGDTTISTIHAYPKTGRTHQIRVHMKAKKNSIVGDTYYQSRSEASTFYSLVDAGRLKKRMYLHALSIKLVIPGDEKKGEQEFVTRLPDEFLILPEG